MIRFAPLLIAAMALALPAAAQDVSHVPAVGSSAAEGRALLEPLCDRFIFAEEKALTCTWDVTGEVITASYTNKGRLYYMQWLPGSSYIPTTKMVEDTVAALGFSGISKPCLFYGSRVTCWQDEDGTALHYETLSDGRLGFYLWNNQIEAADGVD